MKYITTVLLIAVLIVLKMHTPVHINNQASVAKAKTVQVVTPEKVTQVETPKNTPMEQTAPVSETQQVNKTPVVQAGTVKGCEAYRSLLSQYQWDTNVALAVMQAESGCNPDATNNNYNGSEDRGLLQINSIHADMVNNLDDLFTPATNISVAYRIYQANGWHAWSAYNSGRYLRYL